MGVVRKGGCQIKRMDVAELRELTGCVCLVLRKCLVTLRFGKFVDGIAGNVPPRGSSPAGLCTVLGNLANQKSYKVI